MKFNVTAPGSAGEYTWTTQADADTPWDGTTNFTLKADTSQPQVGVTGACNGTSETAAEMDSMLRGGDKNTNEGANPILSVSGTGNTRIVLDFGSQVGPDAVILLLDVAATPASWAPPDVELLDGHQHHGRLPRLRRAVGRRQLRPRDRHGADHEQHDRTVSFDLTTWASQNPTAARRFLIKKDYDGASGRIDFYSREGAPDPGMAPRLISP